MEVLSIFHDKRPSLLTVSVAVKHHRSSANDRITGVMEKATTMMAALRVLTEVRARVMVKPSTNVSAASMVKPSQGRCLKESFFLAFLISVFFDCKYRSIGNSAASLRVRRGTVGWA